MSWGGFGWGDLSTERGPDKKPTDAAKFLSGLKPSFPVIFSIPN